MNDDSAEDLPLVSVVTPSYNHGRFIRETIESVLGQDYPTLEYLVIDGGSTDSTIEILREHEPNLQWSSEPDRGPAHAINKGWRRSRGEILLWVNADDLLLPGAIRTAVAALHQRPDAVGVYGSGLVTDESGSPIEEWPTREVDPRDALELNDPFIQPATYVRAAAARAAGLVDERYRWAFDWDFFLRVMALGPMVATSAPLAVWRRHSETLTETGGIPRLWEIYKMLRRHGAPISAPAYRVYANELLRSKMDRWSGHQSRAVARLAAEVSTRIAASKLAAEVAGGRYADGWATRRVRVYSGDRGSSVLVRGTVDTVRYPALRDQHLTVLVGGEVVTEQTLADGEFSVQARLPQRLGPPWRVEVRATKAFVPRRVGLGADRRHLAYMLHSVDVR